MILLRIVVFLVQQRLSVRRTPCTIFVIRKMQRWWLFVEPKVWPPRYPIITRFTQSYVSRVRVVVNHHYVHKRYNDIHSAWDECTCHTFAANCSGGASALPVQRICGFKLNLEQYARIYPIYILKIYEKYTALYASSAVVNAVHHRWPSRETFLPENGCCGRTG